MGKIRRLNTASTLVDIRVVEANVHVDENLSIFPETFGRDGLGHVRNSKAIRWAIGVVDVDSNSTLAGQLVAELEVYSLQLLINNLHHLVRQRSNVSTRGYQLSNIDTFAELAWQLVGVNKNTRGC